MESKVKVAGHPVHPMLVSFPIAMYTASLASYATYKANKDPFWFKAGYAANVAGVAAALTAAVPGFIDWLSAVPSNTPAKRTGLVHMLLNVGAVTLFGANAIRQSGNWNRQRPRAGSPVLPALGMAATLAAGFYGWSLVQDHHVGVHDRGPEWLARAKRASQIDNRKQPFPPLKEEVPITKGHPGFTEKL